MLSFFIFVRKIHNLKITAGKTSSVQRFWQLTRRHMKMTQELREMRLEAGSFIFPMSYVDKSVSSHGSLMSTHYKSHYFEWERREKCEFIL